MKFITGRSLQSLKVFLSKFLDCSTLTVTLTVLGPNYSRETFKIYNNNSLIKHQERQKSWQLQKAKEPPEVSESKIVGKKCAEGWGDFLSEIWKWKYFGKTFIGKTSPSWARAKKYYYWFVMKCSIFWLIHLTCDLSWLSA